MKQVTSDYGVCDLCQERGWVHVHPTVPGVRVGGQWCTRCEAHGLDLARYRGCTLWLLGLSVTLAWVGLTAVLSVALEV